MAIAVRAGAVIVAAILAAAPPVAAQPPAGIGSNPPGSVFYAVASGLAKVAAQAGVLRLSVQPYSGTSTFIPLLESGELEFGVNNAVDMAMVYRGPGFKVGGRNPFPPGRSLRVVMRGAPLMVAPLVRKDSPIKTVHDAKGRRVTGEYPANLAIWYNIFGELASAGLGWSDVKVVPVPALNDGVEALVQGRADMTSYALNAAKVREADAAVGVRHASIDCSPEGERRLRAAVPGYYPRRVKKGEAIGVLEDMCAVAYDIYIVAGRGVSDAAVQGLLRAVWEHGDTLPAVHVIFREWTRDRLASADVTMPYHPAAIRFFRERGAWTPEMEQAQEKLLALTR
jgi:TRAP transporter TAXI family solute receptor